MTQPRPFEVLSPGLQDLLERFQAGQAAALARAITTVENERAGFQAFLHHVLQAGPRTTRLGLTGPPGAGKSSLVSGLATAYRARGERLGVVAVDPTSPYSGGALLGDRIRMNDLATDPGMFIRSMATRGSLGGLATTSKEVVDLMDAFGFDRVLVETVGVGQTELEITAAADTVVVVLVPESGDGIQAMKAGLMEIADVFVVNKADRPGADRLLKEIRQAMHLRAGETLRDVPAHHGVDLGRIVKKERTEEAPAREAGWSIPVLKTVAQTGEGVPALLDAVDRHREWMVGSGELERRRRERARIRVRD
ncbi:MAG TPA: methylmalonyl Co-A mutase-associated GTPase MeaB, partial [Longimicrobiales bacterium]|nr:methylmalonyl Co-A mutase-associated GTPase MeaB [Longimicrobiales bacterium]